MTPAKIKKPLVKPAKISWKISKKTPGKLLENSWNFVFKYLYEP